jgi:hypothetical protein
MENNVHDLASRNKSDQKRTGELDRNTDAIAELEKTTY